MARLFLAVWLALFAVQTSDLIAAVSPDECVEYSTESAGDPCPDSCARCVCCARVPLFVPHVVASLQAGLMTALPLLPLSHSATSAEPHGIFHVPKTR